MASRRINTAEKTMLEKDDHHELSPPANEKSDTAPLVPTHVIVKLLAFTFAMVVLPIGSYFVTKDTVFGGNAPYAGGFAAMVANVVLIGYVIVAMREEDSDATKEAESKKSR